MTDQDTNNNPVIRENLVQTAVKFLQNPKVATSPFERKKEFLRSKGLTDSEIQRANELTLLTEANNQNIIPSQNFTSIPISQGPGPGPVFSYYKNPPYHYTVLQKIQEFFNITALVGTTIYCIYWFYKKFIEPFLFGHRREETVKDKVTNLESTLQNSVKEIKESLCKVEKDVQNLAKNQVPDPSVCLLVQELKQDLSSLKSLLLSRKQFPSAPVSIPAWQLDPTNQGSEKATEREDDAGSGSSTNNSDSSLEMIREDPPKE